MVKAASSLVSVSVNVVLNSLRVQGIAFRGPFRTPGKRTVFVVESYILLESELVDLFMQNTLNRDGIRGLAERIQAMNSKVDLLTTHNPTE
ncbi:MAG TPA: hypothetical protein VFI45_03300 [Candidatus Acidoferrum sp.]|nr:hypothetical protein [Candidatus Acidoferrum sp.]